MCISPSFRDFLSGIVWTIDLFSSKFKKEPEKNIEKQKQTLPMQFFPSTLVSCGEIMVKQKSKVQCRIDNSVYFLLYASAFFTQVED